MFGSVGAVAEAAVTSWWVYPALFWFALLDGVVPVFPAETLVVTAGLAALQGRPSLTWVVVLAAAGAFAGDHTAYLLGRLGGPRVARWTARGRRRRRAFAWVGRNLQERGGLVLVAARYVAGGRNAATLTMGAMGYPLRRFSLFDGIGAASWALTAALAGYAGGAAFERHPVRGLVLSAAVAVLLVTAAEVVRRRVRRTTSAAGPVSVAVSQSPAPPAAEPERCTP